MFQASLWKRYWPAGAVILAGSLILVAASAYAATDTWSNRNSEWQPSTYNTNIGDDVPRRGTSYAKSPRRSNISPFSPESHNLAIEIGQIFLMGDLNDKYSDNLGFRINYTYGVSDLFAFNAIGGYSEHSDGKFSMTSLQAGLRTNLAWFDKVIPYVNFGLGFYRPRYQFSAAQAADGSTSLAALLFGVHLGGGVTLEISKEFFFGSSLTFQNVFGDTRQVASGPIDIGGTFTTFMLNAGLTL